MLVTSIFSFSHNVFYSIKDRNYHFYYKCFQFGLVQNFVLWEWVKWTLDMFTADKIPGDNTSRQHFSIISLFHPFSSFGIPCLTGAITSFGYNWCIISMHNWKSLWKRPEEKMWEKAKMPVSSISSFSHNVFYPMKDKLIFVTNI